MSDATLVPAASSGGLPDVRARRSWRWRGTRALAIALIAAGSLALLDAGVTLVWQEPLSALYALLRQDRLGGELRRVERVAPSTAERRKLASLTDERQRIAFLARELQRHAREGSPVGRIVIPRLHANYVIVDGTGTRALESGPGIYPQTRFPGVRGTTAIAGHRTTYLAPFRHVDELSRGSRIVLRMPYGLFTYTVTGRLVVAPTDIDAAEMQLPYSRLVLSACTPLFSAEKRLLVYARLSRIVPEGAARRLPGGARPQPIVAPGAPAGHRGRRLPPVLVSLDPHRVLSV